MLETIRQFAEDNSSPAATPRRPATPMLATSASARPMYWRCGIAPDNARLTLVFTVELADLRTAFRWAADDGDLDTPPPSPHRGMARSSDRELRADHLGRRDSSDRPHLRPSPASRLCIPRRRSASDRTRINEAVGYSDAGQMAVRSGSGEVHYGLEGVLASFVRVHRPARTGGRVVSHPARTQPEYSEVTWVALVLTLRPAGCADDADRTTRYRPNTRSPVSRECPKTGTHKGAQYDTGWPNGGPLTCTYWTHQNKSSHSPLTGGQVVAGSNPVSPTQVRGTFDARQCRIGGPYPNPVPKPGLG